MSSGTLPPSCAGDRSRLTDLGLTQPASIPADFTLYDQVLQVTATLGAAPARFRDLLNADGALTSRATSRWPAVRAPVRPWR